MSKSYKIEGVRRVLRTSATRRYLVVSVYDGRPKVETSTTDRHDADAKALGYRRSFGPGGSIMVLDQETMTPR